MCGGCGTGKAAAPWEDLLAGAGPAQRAARAAAAGRLLAGGRLRISTWRGGYLVSTATGGARVARSLDEVWAAAGVPPSAAGPASGGAGSWAWAPLPARWDLQAGLVWLSAAARRGAVTEAVLPVRATGAEGRAGRPVGLAPHGSPVPDPPPGRVGVLGPDPGDALRRLVAFAAAGQPGRR